jgi:hypothetical protein
MPWYERLPSQDELDHYQNHVIFPAEAAHRVSKWPTPNTPRINCRYRVKHTTPTLIPLSHRYGLYYHKSVGSYDPDDPEFNAFGWFDSEIRADNHIGFLTPRNDEGYLLDVDIKAFDELPVSGRPGIEFKVVFDHSTFETLTYHEEYEPLVGSNQWHYNISTLKHGSQFLGYWTEGPQQWDQLLKPRLFGVSDCYTFDRFPIGFAALNGTDSYIALDHNIPRLDVPFKIEADIRLHNVTSFWPLFGLDNTGGFTGMDEDDTIFGFLRIGTTWVPVLDEWFNWKFEFEQVSQLNYRTFIDDVLVDESTGGRQFSHRNMVGVYKHGVSGTIWADMDVKNLKLTIGDVPSSQVVLDMPLQANALDLSTELNHGTTFNMDLPSV